MLRAASSRPQHRILAVSSGQLSGTLASSIKAGDPVTVTGNPARDPADMRLRMVNVRRTSDGANWGFAAGQFVK